MLPDASIQEHCDMVYSLHLLGESGGIPFDAVEQFCEIARDTELPGWVREDLQAGPFISVHNCAYLFATLNILGKRFPGLYGRVLEGRKFALEDLIDLQTHRPKFPYKWAHHSWRVSHWLGGTPSILLSLEQNVPDALPKTGVAAETRKAVDSLINPTTGLIKAYRSSALQALFRLAYGMRHSPALGDIGGIAHVLWVDYCMGRRYVAANHIRAECSRLLLAHKPFMERMPYCLDFDVVQAFRTACDQTAPPSPEEELRIEHLKQDIDEFFISPGSGYTLHKVPGALATYHECDLILGSKHSELSGSRPIDIIKEAKWL